MIYTHLFLGVLLIFLIELSGAQGPCPATCRCTMEILNCSRITSPPGFHQVPLPNLAVRPHPFMYLDFTGNAISSTGKDVWKAYPWTEHLVLKDNSLSRLQSTSLEGLFSLTYLDLSCNKIHIIDRKAFEAVPFLQIINLRGNIIQQIADGTFQAWHGMQFLLKVDLSHNPLAVIEDSHFYGLPSLKFLDLGATDITPKTLEDLLQTSLQLRTLILPLKISCCLCRIKQDIEVLCDTVKLECTESCAINETLCDTEEPLSNMQEEVMKALEIRKKNGKSLLNILPERAIPSNVLPERAKPNKDRLTLTENPPAEDSSLAENYNLLESVKQLMQVKADEPLDVNWADKDELKKLYLLACLLQGALRERIAQLDKESLEADVQKRLSAEVSKVSTDNAAKGSTDASLRKERYVRKVMRENWLGTDQRQKDTQLRVGREGREVAEIATQSANKPGIFESHNKAEIQRKLVEGRALPFLRSQQAALQSSWKRSISDSLTNALKSTGSIEEDNTGHNPDSLSSDGNHLVVLDSRHGAHVLTEEDLLHHLLHRNNPSAEDGKSKISAPDSELSLNELLPDISLSQGTYWEHQRPPVSPPLNLALENDYLLQGDLFEDQLNKQLTPLIPNTPVRKLISHIIRILKMDCMAPTIQMACTKLISRTGLLMKLFSENVNETSALWKSYFWPSKKVANTTTEKSRKLEKPLGKTTGQAIPAYEKKLLWAVLVAAVIMIIIAVICLVEICSHRSAAKRKKTSSDLESSRTESQLTDKPLWLQDMYQEQDETQKNSMVVKLHDEESSEEVDIVGKGSARSSLAEASMKKVSSKALSVPTEEKPPPPPAASTAKKDADKGAAAEEGDDEEESGEKSEAPTTEATGESDEEEEEEEEEEEDD